MPLHEANSRFKDVDQLTHELYGDRSYDKTKFQLNFSLNGEQVVYEGVQNLGNLEGSLIDHIRISYFSFQQRNHYSGTVT